MAMPTLPDPRTDPNYCTSSQLTTVGRPTYVYNYEILDPDFFEPVRYRAGVDYGYTDQPLVFVAEVNE